MAASITFTPKASLTDAPTNLKEAIDWVLRVTGKDGKALNKETECICGLAAAVTDLLQSVQLEYHGYQGDVKNGTTDSGANNGATEQQVIDHLNGLFSLVQGLGGTAVVRTYIDQLAQVLSALVGWSKIETCDKSNGKCGGDEKPHGQESCKYLKDVTRDDRSCDTCGCMKWDVADADNESKGHHLGRRCTRCSGGGSDCTCKDGEDQCAVGTECKCAKAGKCCKCCCNGRCGNCKRECSCIIEDGVVGRDECNRDSYMSAYPSRTVFMRESFTQSKRVDVKPYWKDLIDIPPGDNSYDTTASDRRHQCAQTLLGSVCLIWSGITYLYWTGKYHWSSPRWNNHILDGSGLDDGTLSQWLQALGFPRDMLNNSGPQNRLDKVIWDGLNDKLLLGFAVPSGLNTSGVANDHNGNTARNPFNMNYAGFVHTAHRDSFNEQAIVFKNDGSSTTDTNQHKIGAIFKLYILSCAYFTGLQKKSSTQSTAPRNPKTIRDILYWLSALPYSPAYPKILIHGKDRLKEVLKKPGETDSTNGETQLKFYQTGLKHPITVDEYNLFAHFQAVTQYCPLVLIGIQGGLKGTDKTLEPAIHALYANTECNFTYPTVSIQAYNQVVHYIRALFYQLYFLRKQCAVKVTCGGKWRECRYGSGVLGKDVVSWMCLGCNPMEHDRKGRVEKVKDGLDGVKEGADSVAAKVKALLEAIGEVVVQLGNAQEALEKKAENKAIEGVKGALEKAKKELEGAKGEEDDGVLTALYAKLEEEGVEWHGQEELVNAREKIKELTKNDNGGLLKGLLDKLDAAKGNDFDQAKNAGSSAIHKVQEILTPLKNGLEAAVKTDMKEELNGHQETLLDATRKIISIYTTAKCSACQDHSNKCGKTPKPTTCPTCHQPTTTGVPSPLQAFLEDRLPGFSCQEVVNDENDTPNYPPAASHLGHCNGSGQCCPLPMGFRNNFHKGSTSDSTGARLYGILYFFSNENMMQSCVYTLVRVTAALSATTPQVLGDVFGFFRGGVGNKERGKPQKGEETSCEHTKDPSTKGADDYFCGWCASGLREEVKKIEWIQKITGGDDYRESVGKALRDIKGSDSTATTTAYSSTGTTTTSLSALTKDSEYLSPLTGELYTAVSATFGNTYLSWVLYLSDALHWGLQSLSEAFQQIECRGCKGQCDPNKCRKGEHGSNGGGQCGCQSIVSCTGVLPVLYRHGFSYGNPFNLEGYQQKDGSKEGDYSIENTKTTKHCHEFLESLSKVLDDKQATSQDHPLTNLLSQVGQLQYDIRLPWIFALTMAWLVAVLYLAFGAIWPLDWTHMRSHWLRGGEHQWQCMWYKVMTGRKGVELVEYLGRK
ncbi:variant erythrocyte surface antigen-1 alpha subunit [Babesia bovis T2Bo]|uniref:Variant erythrocyte surface antigen-1, putative n=1 Tax=Babesia bovis TaxID=5865 RepID=A7AXH9_BABBO|nr:variant erythrocyte surface antigen-1 alpha subunit [Babesia bovis T2Bo]KAG6440206.1 variant erythrocyte surface antigen-1 alpha subunit [Babesia bovis T2Bo]|eukprot:XP_001608626.1 variant erythrocyte surface antigen-1 [Babesia bovis T2Bo]